MPSDPKWAHPNGSWIGCYLTHAGLGAMGVEKGKKDILEGDNGVSAVDRTSRARWENRISGVHYLFGLSEPHLPSLVAAILFRV